MDSEETPALSGAWAALGGDPALLDRVEHESDEAVLPARLAVRELAGAMVGACALAAAELAAVRTGGEVPRVRVADRAVAAAFTSERLLRLDGRAPVSFAPLSRMWRTADGWVRTHANYPHHRRALLEALRLDGAAGPEEVARALRGRAAREVEESVYAAGGLAVALRGPGEWAASAQGQAVAALPLVSGGRVDTGVVRRFAPLDADAPEVLPLSGVRVLDLTRVIAGPVATRTLALLGADVLRLDAPSLPELPDQQADTGLGKRSASLDLKDCARRRRFEELLEGADVVVTGYRPGALERLGLTPDGLAGRRAGLVVAQLSAWGRHGPWGERRGFDSLVQVATGIAAVEADRDGRPGVLPAQALDHGTGYLLAGAVLRALTEQTRTGGARLARLTLAGTAGWLLGGARGDRAAPDLGEAPDLSGRTAERDSEWGRLTYALPPVDFAGGPRDWATPSVPTGSDTAAWR